MFEKILIANRGAIACRIIRTLKKMNITAVAVYAEADVDSLHVEQADEAYSLGDGAVAATYLNQNKIIDIAKKCGARAIHPGYGFLSENPAFVRLCKENGVVFIGPSTDNMNCFALKHKARELAQIYEVPLVPGSGLLANCDDAIRSARHIGYPVILKSSAGGGGIGMQVCSNDDELNSAFDSVQRLSRNNFSDERLFLEKYIEKARHIEVQVFGNGEGVAVALGERDCSLQRRNQKVVEEAPAPNLNDATRERLHETAIRLLAGVNYANAGTVEFIYDSASGDFYFLEVNTRLQVEHGVTEEVFSIDLVAWMIEQAYSPIKDLEQRRAALQCRGHAIQARVYAEIPEKNFQPSAGILSHVEWPQNHGGSLRIDTWISPGIEISSFYDPMLAKIICHADNRETAIAALTKATNDTCLYGVANNLAYVTHLLKNEVFARAEMFTRYLQTWSYRANSVEVLSAGTMTTIQDTPGRTGYWEVGVPPSGPFDTRSFSLGNSLLKNSSDCAGLEITLSGPTLKFYAPTAVVITGADIDISVDGMKKPQWQVINIQAGQTLAIGKISACGSRAYLLIKNGFQCPDYLGSKSTFTLGRFGGHVGRALKTGDMLLYDGVDETLPEKQLAIEERPEIGRHWTLNVIYGPHGAPEFFTRDSIARFFQAEWEVHYNSSRTGVRLVGPKPEWSRTSGGEAGMHPSNIHDNAYAFGSVDFTGDMPVILGPDGPSLGGFVCPATVTREDLWKLGQLRAGDKLHFQPIKLDSALARVSGNKAQEKIQTKAPALIYQPPETCVLAERSIHDLEICIRLAGDSFLLIEFGKQVLDLRLRMRVHALQESLRPLYQHGIMDLTPGIRSLQVHFDPERLSHTTLLKEIDRSLDTIENQEDLQIPSRVVHLPLSWNDEACHRAVEKYQQSVRADAPWCPDNIEFIRRINGLSSVEDVKSIVFDAHYVVMGLGDVYLGAPVATPLDPCHRLVTTKYNPARTWTAENSVGIGGAYLCIYGMEGPGGYQFIGRTLQMWNRYKNTREFNRPWLLRYFDQIRFFEVSHQELTQIRRHFPKGQYSLQVEEQQFSLRDYQQFLDEKSAEIRAFQKRRETAFEAELARWESAGNLHFEAAQPLEQSADDVPDGLNAIESPATGNVWQITVKKGELVQAGQVILILESMKMEIEVAATCSGKIHSIVKTPGSLVSAGQALILIEETKV